VDRVVTYRLSDKDHAALRALAEEQGVKIGTLTRSLVLAELRRRDDPRRLARMVLDAIEGDAQLGGQLRRIALFFPNDGSERPSR
jgi:hypothetical protein